MIFVLGISNISIKKFEIIKTEVIASAISWTIKSLQNELPTKRWSNINPRSTRENLNPTGKETLSNALGKRRFESELNAQC